MIRVAANGCQIFYSFIKMLVAHDIVAIVTVYRTYYAPRLHVRALPCGVMGCLIRAALQGGERERTRFST